MTDQQQIERTTKGKEIAITPERDVLADTKDKGKMVIVSPGVIDISEISATDPNQILEVRVYRKWISRNVPDPNPTGLRFILIDRRVSIYIQKLFHL